VDETVIAKWAPNSLWELAAPLIPGLDHVDGLGLHAELGDISTTMVGDPRPVSRWG
jgi:hypothetical protein